MINGIKLIQRERAENALHDMFIESAVETGTIADLLEEGALPSEEEIHGEDTDLNANEDPVIIELINRLPADINEDEVIDKLVNSKDETTLGELLAN